MCSCDYDEQPEFYYRKPRKSRQPHTCDECRRTIQPGETYDLHVGKWDGRIDTFRWCAHCTAAQKIVAERVDCDCWTFGDLWHDSLGEDIRESRDLRSWRLWVAAQHDWTYRRGPKAGQLMPVPTFAVELRQGQR